MPPQVLRRGPHRLLLLFLAATALPAAALVWLGWQLVSQDRELESTRLQERLDSRVAELASAAGRELAALDRDLPAMLTGGIDPPAGDALVVRLSRDGLEQHAGAPLVALLTESPRRLPSSDDIWRELERAELADARSTTLVDGYQRLAASPDPDVRAGSLVRLARVLKKSGQPERALETYSTLARLTDARVDGDPASLFGRIARIDLLRAIGRDTEAKEEAEAFARELGSGRDGLDRVTYEAWAETLEPLLARDEAMLAIASAVGAAWSDWRDGGGRTTTGRRVISDASRDAFVTWRADDKGVVLLAATPQALADRLFSAERLTDVHLALVDDAGRAVTGESNVASDEPAASIEAADSGLPWTIRVSASGVPAEIAEAGRTRRALLMTGLLLLAVLLPASGYLVSRAVRRELAVARQQSNFVSAVSHEFRSPLTSLTHLTSLLRSDFQPSDERRRKYYDVLAHETERLRRFVDTLLDFGRMQAGTSPYRLKPTDVEVFVRGLVEEFRRDGAADGRVVSCSTSGTVPAVAADVDALGRAVWNLLENAVKYSPADTTVDVKVEAVPESGTVAIRVTDHGAGIPEDEQAHVFEQFYRGASAVESATRGTGVGLAVVDHIVRGHRGEMQLTSRVGAGSTFSILLPVLDEADAESARRVS